MLDESNCHYVVCAGLPGIRPCKRPQALLIKSLSESVFLVMQDGKKDGLGTYWWPTGASYKGEWSDGSMHGVGTFESPDGTRYQGGWARDLKQGLGKKWFPNGDTYEATSANCCLLWPTVALIRRHWLCNMQMYMVLIFCSYHIHEFLWY